MKIARNILLILETLILTLVFAYEVYILVELTLIGGWASLGWVIMLVIFAIASIILMIMGVIATVLTSKLNKKYFNPTSVEENIDRKKYSNVLGILAIALPIVTLLIYFLYPIIFIF